MADKFESKTFTMKIEIEKFLARGTAAELAQHKVRINPVEFSTSWKTANFKADSDKVTAEARKIAPKSVATLVEGKAKACIVKIKKADAKNKKKETDAASAMLNQAAKAVPADVKEKLRPEVEKIEKAAAAEAAKSWIQSTRARETIGSLVKDVAELVRAVAKTNTDARAISKGLKERVSKLSVGGLAIGAAGGAVRGLISGGLDGAKEGAEEQAKKIIADATKFAEGSKSIIVKDVSTVEDTGKRIKGELTTLADIAKAVDPELAKSDPRVQQLKSKLEEVRGLSTKDYHVLKNKADGAQVVKYLIQNRANPSLDGYLGISVSGDAAQVQKKGGEILQILDSF